MIESLKDRHLRLDPRWFHVCVPFRLCIGFAILFVLRPTSTVAAAALGTFSLVAALGLGYKWRINPASWKNYYRSIAVLSVIALACAYMWWINDMTRLPMLGALIIIDALMGQQSHYTATILSTLR